MLLQSYFLSWSTAQLKTTQVQLLAGLVARTVNVQGGQTSFLCVSEKISTRDEKERGL